MLEQLSALPKLAKPHLSWPFQLQPGTKAIPMWLPEHRALLKEYARITGSVPLSLEWFTPDQARTARELATAICVSSSPYQRMRKGKLAAASIGAEFLADLADYRARLEALAALPVGHLVIDVEHWRAQDEDGDALREKYGWLDRIARDCLPAARIIYYERGAVQPNNAGDDGYLAADWHPADSPGDINSCSLYFSEWAVNQETYRRTIARAAGLPVACFLSLGTSQRRGGAGWSGEYPPGGYDPETAWQVGLELNHPWAAERPRRYPCSTTPLVSFWPAAFDPNYPGWAEQFVAYCRGATGEKLRKSD